MGNGSLLEVLAAIGSIITPVIVLALTAVGWKYKQSIERRATLEEKLRDDRIEIYNKILEPFILMLTPEAAWQYDKRSKNKTQSEIAVPMMLSVDYRITSFKLSLLGSDNVVIAFNNLMQHFYSHQDRADQDLDIRKTMMILGTFLLEIRRSMGNEATALDNWSMLEWFMTEARKLRGSSRSTDNAPNTVG